MGGSGSTRWDGHRRRATTADAAWRLRATDVRRAHPALGAGDAVSGVWGWPDGARMGYTLGAVDDAGRRPLVLTYRTRQGAGPWQNVRCVLPTVSDPVRVGARVVGARWWFWCASCQRRRAAVYRAPGARVFRCRACAGLAYPVQRLDPLGRAQRAAVAAARRLGCDDFGDGRGPWAPRPKWMRQATYRRHLAALGAADAQCDALFLAGAARLLARRPRARKKRQETQKGGRRGGAHGRPA